MTVRELIELNMMITDIEITVRKNGGLLDQLNIGPAEGIKPPYPTMVPKEERWVGNLSRDRNYSGNRLVLQKTGGKGR